MCAGDAAFCQITLATCYGRPYVVMGRPLCFIPVIYYFFRALIFEAEKHRPVGPLPGYRNMVLFYNADQRGPYLYPLHFEGRKSANFDPHSWAIFLPTSALSSRITSE